MREYLKYGIDLSGISRTSGEVGTTCPKCSEGRKKKSDKCLFVNLDKKVWKCHHCGWSGGIKPEKEKIIYAKPTWTNNTSLSDKVVKWFKDQRGIGQQILIDMKITEGMEFMPQSGQQENTIQFNYFKDAELVNVKYRTGGKLFKLFKDAELVFYNIDCVKNNDVVYIVEGEMDVLAIMEAGIKNIISVPNGANLNKNNLQYVDNCIDYFDNVKEIYLATDSDIAGRNLQEELSLRFGKDKCYKVDFKDCKDANEYLLKYGATELAECLKVGIHFPIEGVFTISDISDEIDDMYINGLERGVGTGLPGIDRCVTFVKGYVTTITGIPSHGKSEFLDFLLIRLNLLHNWKGAFFSPENRPLKLHFSKMAEKLIGKSWDGNYRMSSSEKDNAKEFLNEKIWFIKPSKDFGLDGILDTVKLLVRQYGIDYFVIDAWNKLEHKYDSNETKYIGDSLDKIVNFCETNQVHCFLVAHPKKIQKEKTTGLYETPTLYDIAGSANFFNKTDVGICVYRDFDKKETNVYFQKVKFRHWGVGEFVTLQYDLNNGRYYETGFGDATNWITRRPENKTQAWSPSLANKQKLDYSMPLTEQSGDDFLTTLSK